MNATGTHRHCRQTAGYLLLLVSMFCLVACQSAGERKEAAEDRERIAQLNTQLAVQYAARQDYATALQKLEKALEADSNYVDAHDALGVLRARLGQFEDAERSFSKALKIDPDNSTALNNYGQFLCQRGRYAEGQKSFLKAVENPLYRLPAAAYTNAGTCALDSGDPESAEIYYRKALAVDPRFPPTLFQMAALSLRLERYLPARGYLQRYQEVAQQSAASLWLGIRIERQLGDEDAVASYELLLERSFPDAPETRLLFESRAQ